MNDNLVSYTDKIIELYNLLWDDFHKISFSQFRKYKFTAPQAMTVRQLQCTPYITLKELSEKLNLSKSTVSGIVDKLEKQGVLVREIPENNRRIVRLSLSDKFIEDTDLSYVKREYFLNAIKNTSQDDLEKIIYGLDKFHMMIDSHDNTHYTKEYEK